MKRCLVFLILAAALFLLGAKSRDSRTDRLVTAVHEYISVLDKTVAYDSLSLADQTKMRQALREIERLNRDVKYGR